MTQPTKSGQSPFEAIVSTPGLDIPEKDALPFLAGRISDQGIYLEHLHDTVQHLVNHIAELTSRLVLLQTEIRHELKDLRTETMASRVVALDTSAQMTIIQHSIAALRQSAGVLPLPPERPMIYSSTKRRTEDERDTK